MPRTLPARLGCLVLTLAVSLSAPVQALAHGVAHGRGAEPAHHHDEGSHGHDEEGLHLAVDGGVGDEHGARPGDEHGVAAVDLWMVAPVHHSGGHGHLTLDDAVGTRATPRLVDALPAVDPHPGVSADVVLAHARAAASRAHLAPPDPWAGPPPTLRAPPTR